MLKRFLCVLLTLSVLGTCVAFPAFSAENVTELFADDFESYGDVGTAVPVIGANPWNSATNAVVAQDPLDSGNKVCEIFASGTQYWPSLHKTVAMQADEATVFTGRVMLHPTENVPAPAFYLEYRNSVGNDQANRQHVFHITPSSIRGMNSADDYGDIAPDTWVSYKVEIIPGEAGKETEVTVTVTGDGLTNADGEKVSEITFTDKKVLDNIGVYANQSANMVHNTNINEPGDTKQAKIYLDDVRIYAPPMLSRDATLASLTYGDGNTSVNGFDPDIVEYRVSLDVGTESVSLSAVPNDPEATVQYSTERLTEFPGSITATVTAPYGNKVQYVVNFRIKSSESEVESEILKVKNGAAGIVTLTYDDGDISTAEFNADMFEKYDLCGTNFLIGKNLTSAVLPRMQAVVERGRIDVASHGMYHDGGVYNPDSTEQYYQEEIVDSKAMFENAFPSLDVIVFGPGDGRITDRGLELVKENYYAQRKGTRGFGSVEPDEDELWDAYVKGIHDDPSLAGRNGWVDTVIENGQWLIELWHSIDAPGYMPQTQEDAEAHYSYISQKQKEGKIWVATYTQAVKYMREKKVSESVATLVGDTVEVNLSYPDSALPTDIFDYPLTVKVEVPSEWGSAQVSQNGQTKLVSTYTENGKTWANADIVPNGGIAALTEGVTGGKLASILLNGAALSGFDADQLSYTVDVLDADLPITVSAQPLDSGATVTYSPSATVTETPATVTIQVTDSEGVEKQYTVTFNKQASGNNKLASLSINGTPLSFFNPDVTDYLVKAEKPEGGVVLAAEAEDAAAKISYSANNITTLPQKVTVTVTAENGAEKIYTLNLSDRNADTVFADDDFSSYTVGQNITQETWSTNNGTTNGTMGALDPFDETNQVGKFYNITGGVQNQQMNRYLGGANNEPIIVKGRYLLPSFSSGSFMEVIVRGNGVDGINAAKFAANGDILIGSSTVAAAKFAENEWVNYIFVIKPDTNRYSVTGYFYGDGARTVDGEKAAVVTASGYTANNSKTNMAQLDARILIKGNMTNGEGNVAYVDDIKIYSAGSFSISMPETENINTLAGITVKANHDIDMTMVTADSVELQNESGQLVEIESVTVGDEEITVKTLSVLPNGSYTLALKDSVKDVIGQSASNTIAFTVNNPNFDEIKSLTINTPDNLDQAYDAMETVNFEVTPDPTSNIDTSSIRWYVNDELQSTVGTTFSYKPTECGETYRVYAKVISTGVTSEVRTIEVEEHPIVPITALALNTPANINQTVGNVTAVTFTAQTTPAEYVDTSTIEWYLNGEKQNTAGATFTFTPADEVGTHSVYAKVNGQDVISDTKTVSVTLRIPQEDVYSLNEPFSTTEYKAGDKVITNSDSVTSHRYSGASGMVAADPKNENNLVARFNKGDYLQFRSTLPAEDTTYFISGDLLIPELSSADFDIMQRNAKAPQLIKLNNAASKDGRVFVAGKQMTDIHILENEWVHYTVKIVVDSENPANSTVQLFLSGGLLEQDYYESEIITCNLTDATGSGKYLVYRSSPNNEDKLPLIDNMKVYTTTDLLASMEQTSGVATDAPVVVTFNHDIAPSTLTAENVTLQTSSGEKVALASVTFDALDPSRVTLTPASALAANTSYTVLFSENVKDVAGNSAANIVSFTTSDGGVTPDPDEPSYKIQFSATGAGTISYSGPDGTADLGSGGEKTLAQGSDVTVTANAAAGSEFLYWVRVDTGRIVSEEAAYSFTVGSAAQLAAVFGGTDGQNLAVFTSGRNGQVIQSGYTAGSVLVPDAPYVMGYTFTGWLRDRVPQKFNSGDSIEVTGDVVYEAWYEQKATTYTITVENGTGSGEYKFNDEVTAVANTAPSGQKFSHWTKDGAVVSYDATYTFYASGAATVTAVYVGEGETVNAEPVLVASATPLAEDSRIAFFSERDLPDEWEVIETGLLLSEEADFDLDTAAIKAASTSTEKKGQYTVRKAGVQSGEQWYGRAYVVYRVNGETKVLYSDVVSATL